MVVVDLIQKMRMEIKVEFSDNEYYSVEKKEPSMVDDGIKFSSEL